MAENTANSPRKTRLPSYRRFGRAWLLLPLLLGACLFLGWAWMTDWFAPINSDDIQQLRANITSPMPQKTVQIRQTFIPRRDNLTEINVMISRLNSEDGNGRLEMQLLNQAGNPVAARTLEIASLTQNQVVILNFQPLEDSAGELYTLLISGVANQSVSIWGYDLDVYEDGELTLIGAETEAADLRFVTRYRLTPFVAIQALLQSTSSYGWLMVLALTFMLLPGCLLLMAAHRWLPHMDPAAWLGMALALGVAIWPIAWLWLSITGIRWRSWSLWLVFIVGWLLVIGLTIADGNEQVRDGINRLVDPGGKRKAGESEQLRPKLRISRLSWHHGVLLLILLLGLSVRLLAVRDLAFPPWVDSTRHALITAVMVESGQVIHAYEPFLNVYRFPYHFGFHTLSSSLALMRGEPLPGLLLVLGQFINSLVPLAVYAATYLPTRRRGVALLAAFLVALPFFFPGYYATWGRMTQLTAMLVLTAAVAVLWMLIRGARGWRRSWWILAILATGIFLIHFRIFLFFLVLVALVWLISRGRQGRWLGLATLVALILALPQISRLFIDSQNLRVGGSIPGYNDFPFGYVTIGWERAFLVIAAASLLLAAFAGLWRKRWIWFPMIMAAWAGLVVIFLSGQGFRTTGSGLINLNSAYISAFLPLALILAATGGQIWRWLSRRRTVKAGAAFIAGGILVAAMLFGMRQQITILNPVTILAWPQDADGLVWMQENLQAPVKVAVNSWRWLGSTWAGSDGGAWIVPLTGLVSTTPPADYIYNRALASDVNAFNLEASKERDWSDPAAAGWLREQGISHVFIGAKGGFFDPSALEKNPEFRQLYGRDGVFIFALK